MKNSVSKKPKIDGVEIRFIDHKDQRYDTVGDWFYELSPDRGLLCLRISRLPNDPDNEKALAIAVHELCEVLICRANGISQKSVDKFDKDFTKKHPTLEPGDSKSAPYRHEHCFATAVERLLIAAMRIDWESYENSVGDVK